MSNKIDVALISILIILSSILCFYGIESLLYADGCNISTGIKPNLFFGAIGISTAMGIILGNLLTNKNPEKETNEK